MKFLPIVDRELRVAARRRGTYWGRTASAALALSLGAFVYAIATGRGTAPAELGLALFAALAWLLFLSCLLAGVRLTADCISSERREATLGLLFLTDLRGYDIVLGKLVASSVNAIQGMLAAVPVLAIAVLQGGVSGGQVVRTVVLLVTLMLYSLALGLFISMWFRDGRRAALLTGVLLLGLCVGPPIAMALVHQHQLRLGGQGPPPLQWAMSSPLYPQSLAVFGDRAIGGMRAPGFWAAYAIQAGQALGLLGLASLLLPRVWRDRAASVRGPGWRVRWLRWTLGSGEARRRFRHRLLEINPFYWLAARDRWQPIYVWAFLILTGCAALAFRFLAREAWDDAGAGRYVLLTIVLHGVLRLWVAGAASRQLATDRRDGTLELLLSTPLNQGQIFQGQFRALYRQFGAAFVAVLVADLALWWAGSREEDSGFGPDAVLFWAGVMAMLVLDAYALAWQGLWCAVASRRPQAAAVQALTKVVAWPWGILLGLAWLAHVFRLEPSWENPDKLAFGLWFGLGLVVDVVLANRAQASLRAHFREYALQRVRPLGGWRAWLGAR